MKVRSAAAKTSFQVVTKTKIADAATPGRASGSATRRKADNRPQPERHRRLLELVRDAREDAGHDEHRERQREGDVRHRHPVDRVVDPDAERHGQRDGDDDEREARATQRQLDGFDPLNVNRAIA